MKVVARRGVALVEVLVVIGIVGVLAALMLPAVQSAREASRRASCMGNLRSLALALHAYEESWGSFPSMPTTYLLPIRGRAAGPYFSAHAELLPQLEQSALFNSINFRVAARWIDDFAKSAAIANDTAARQTVGVFLCPSDSLAYASPYGPANYRGNDGLCGNCASGIHDGAFAARGVHIREFTDGLSATLVFSEKLVGSRIPGSYIANRDWIRDFPAIGVTDPRAITVTAWVDFCASLTLDLEQVNHDAGRTWMLSGSAYSTFYVSVPPNSFVPDCGGLSRAGYGVFAARSLHPGGVNAALADGSVRFFPNSVNVQVWRALGTRSGEETISEGE